MGGGELERESVMREEKRKQTSVDWAGSFNSDSQLDYERQGGDSQRKKRPNNTGSLCKSVYVCVFLLSTL